MAEGLHVGCVVGRKAACLINGHGDDGAHLGKQSVDGATLRMMVAFSAILNIFGANVW